MIVYHGSNSNFKKLRIAKELVKHESTKTNEGMGIYFSTDREVAESYGKYVYTLEINDKYFVDFRNRPACSNYLSQMVNYIYRETGVKILDYISLLDTVNRMYYGGLSISGVGREIYMLLDSTESFYKLPQSRIDKVFSLLKSYDKNHLYAYMFNYNIKNCGVIKKVNDNIVRIVNKEKMY